jgi:ribonucleoside-triphosphate reductase
MDMVNKAFIEIMIEGDANGRGFQYPIPTYSITKDFDWSETENNKLLFEMTAKYGTPYFSNYINSDMEPSDVRSMCCRLRLDLRELRKKSGGYFGSGESTGSVGVVTINMPRIAYLSKDENEFYERLEKLMNIAARSLKIKRNVITKLLDEGLYPYTKRYLGTFNNHFSTIGLVGMNEVCLNAKWIKEDLTHEKAQEFTKDVLNFMREKLSDYQEEYGDLYNLEATPAESTSYRMAKKDKALYPDIITASNDETPYYTNSSHLPVGYTDDIFEALDIQDELQTLYTSGTVFHAFMGERLEDWKAAANLVRKIAENYRLPYYTLSPTYSVCKNHGYITGEVYKCPECGCETEVYSRITGYYRPVKNWNDGKAKEFEMRKEYDMSKALKADKKSSKKCDDKKDCKCNDGLKDGILLFGTKTCPNCKSAKKLLDKAKVKYDFVDAEEEVDLTNKLGVKQAPTLVVIKKGDVEVIPNLSNIKKYAESQK